VVVATGSSLIYEGWLTVKPLAFSYQRDPVAIASGSDTLREPLHSIFCAAGHYRYLDAEPFVRTNSKPAKKSHM
jgi:hypothetical protein